MRSILSFIGFIVICWLAFTYFFVKGCNTVEDKGNGNIVVGIGAIVKDIKKDFDKGYKSDTLTVDSLNSDTL